jgi:filamentous hemagglutinin family protein
VKRSLFYTRALCASAFLLAGSFSLSALADPTLPTGFDASQSIGVQSVTNNNTVQTIITDAQRSVGSFENFSIGQGYTVNVNQPNSAASFLAVSRDSNPSLIYGALNSNGHVWVANPYGVFVGPTGVISVAGFLGASQQISTQDFVNNVVKFDNLTGSVVNQGHITGTNYAILLGKNVENTGVIEAAKVALFAGKSVDVATQDGVHFKLNPSSTVNTGFVNEDGSLYQHVVNNSGRIQANAVSQNDQGEVVLLAVNGSATNSGAITASGGSVAVLGDTVDSAGTIDVSSATGNGGKIRIGGDFYGAGSLPTANKTTVSGNLLANGVSADKGGSVVVWSNKDTNFTGKLLAKGGQAEISSKGLLGVSGFADLGNTGVLLLDPFDLIVKTGGGINTASKRFVDTAFLQTAVGNLVLEAERDASINNAVTRDNTGDFTLNAGRNIAVSADLSVNGNTALNASGAISINNNATVSSTGSTALTSKQAILIGGTGQTSGGVFGDTGVSITASSTAQVPAVQGAVALPADANNSVTIYSTVASNNGDVTVRSDDTISLFKDGTISTPNGSVSLAGNLDGINAGTPEQIFVSGNVSAGQTVTLASQVVRVTGNETNGVVTGGRVSALNGTVDVTADRLTTVVQGRPNGVLEGDALQLNVGSGGVNLPETDFVSVAGTVAGDAILTDREALVSSGLTASGTSTININGASFVNFRADNQNPELPAAGLVADGQQGLRASVLRNFAGPLSQRGGVSIQNNIGNTDFTGDTTTESGFTNNGLTPASNGNGFLPSI